MKSLMRRVCDFFQVQLGSFFEVFQCFLLSLSLANRAYLGTTSDE